MTVELRTEAMLAVSHWLAELREVDTWLACHEHFVVRGYYVEHAREKREEMLRWAQECLERAAEAVGFVIEFEAILHEKVAEKFSRPLMPDQSQRFERSGVPVKPSQVADFLGATFREWLGDEDG